MVDEDFIDVDEANEPESSEQRAAARSELERRCDAVGIELKEEDIPFSLNEKYFLIELPAGREKREFLFWEGEEMRSVLSIPFEKYVFLRPYDAICSYSDGTVEALLQILDR